MFINNAQELAENKLLLLHILDCIEFPLTNSQLTQLVLENDIMNYFMLQQFISELKESKFIVEQTRDNSQFFIITEKGKNTLSYFKNRIPQHQIQQINGLLNAKKQEFIRNMEIKAEYIKLDENDYIVDLSVLEKERKIIHLQLNVATNKQAKHICENWRKDAQNLYGDIIQLLIQ